MAASSGGGSPDTVALFQPEPQLLEKAPCLCLAPWSFHHGPSPEGRPLRPDPR